MGRIQRVKLSSQAFRIAPEKLRHGHIERHVSTSTYLQNSRGVDVYLPPGYDPHDAFGYPVLYMHDGNNLFFKELAFGGMPWGVDKVLDRLISLKRIPPLIVVGVYNTLGRNSEYTWTPMFHHRGREGGEGALYARYLIDELMPFIDTHYATRQGPQFTGVMGSSLGGLISFYLGYYYPDVFGRIGMVSPSLWWDHGKPLQDARNFPQGLQLWLDMGTREGLSRGMRVEQNPNLHRVRTLARVLQHQGYRLGHDLGYLEDRGALHNEWWWGQRVHLALIFLFGSAASRRRILRSSKVRD